MKFTGSCLKQPKISYTYGKVVNIYIVYELGASSSYNNDPKLKSCLFDAVTLIKNADIYKYGYSGFGIVFDRRPSFSFPGSGFDQNVLIFGVDMSFSANIDEKRKDILVLRKGPTQGLENNYNGANSYSFVNDTEIYKFKAKDPEIAAIPLCLGNISKDWSTNNMKKNRV